MSIKVKGSYFGEGGELFYGPRSKMWAIFFYFGFRCWVSLVRFVVGLKQLIGIILINY